MRLLFSLLPVSFAATGANETPNCRATSYTTHTSYGSYSGDLQ